MKAGFAAGMPISIAVAPVNCAQEKAPRARGFFYVVPQQG